MAEICRKRLVVKGSVQGVGFRFFVIRLAESYEVTGYVRNLPDSSVEVVAEGPGDQVDQFVERAARGPSSSRVTERKIYHQEPTGNYNSFGVTY